MQVIDYYYHSLFPCWPWGVRSRLDVYRLYEFSDDRNHRRGDYTVKSLMTSNQVSISIALKASEVVAQGGMEDSFNRIDCTRVN